MISLGTVFLALLLLAWVVMGLRVAAGALRLPLLRNIPPAAHSDCPRISVIFAARDEAEKLPQALATLVALDYPRYEIIAVNDRSREATPQILSEFARQHSQLKVVQLAELPAGWLGKPHALQKGYEESTGEWLVFTDADVRFAPDLLRRSIALVRKEAWDHLTLLGNVDMVGFWEKVVITFFALGFHLANEPGRARDPQSKRYLGVGSFQLVRREAYEASGTHRRLALEVVDDMKLGKIVKEAGFRSGVGVAAERVSVRWHAGLGNIIRGVEKNFFASTGFRVHIVLLQLGALLALNLLPFAVLPFSSGINFWLAAAAAAVPVLMQGMVARVLKVSPLYGLTYPLGAVIFAYMIVRSMVVTLRQGGIVWRDTFYPLDELRKGVV